MHAATPGGARVLFILGRTKATGVLSVAMDLTDLSGYFMHVSILFRPLSGEEASKKKNIYICSEYITGSKCQNFQLLNVRLSQIS